MLCSVIEHLIDGTIALAADAERPVFDETEDQKSSARGTISLQLSLQQARNMVYNDFGHMLFDKIKTDDSESSALLSHLHIK